MSGDEADVRALRSLLKGGLSTAEEDVRKLLGLAPDTDDARVASALVNAVGGAQIKRVEVETDRARDPRPMPGRDVVGGADSSFLGQLSTTDVAGGGLLISRLDDPRTVLAVARAGDLRQRRAAIERLGHLVSDARKDVPSNVLKEATGVLARLRDVEVAFELSEARARLSGAVGRQVRNEREQFDRWAASLKRSIQSYWDGEEEVEPVTALPGDRRAALLMRVRDLPGLVVDHLGALVESADVVDREERLSLLASLRFANDPRLVAPLVAVLEGRDAELAVEAARALGRVEDPRVHPVLLSAYERNVVDRQRTVIAGALGHSGDARGAEYVRQALDSDDVETVRHALAALDVVGAAEDTDAVVVVLDRGDPSVTVAAIRTLARIGDGRALGKLAEMRDQTSVSALWAEMEDAEAAIRARLELRGEEVEGVAMRTSDQSVAITKATPAWIRLRGWKDYLVGRVWLFFRARNRAIARFDRAAVTRPEWIAPHIAIAMVHFRKNRYAAALASFRRAVEVDRSRVERAPWLVGALARTFLRRAEDMEHDGRGDIARGLLEEAVSLDLRRAPSAIRFEITRRHEAMSRRGG